MLIYFIYKNNSFNFSIKNDVSIIYLKNLVSKMIQKDKTCFDLFYNNKILPENNSSLFQISKNESNMPIIISLKKNSYSNTNSNKMKLPILAMPNKLTKNPIDIENKNKLNLNESEICNDSFFKEINKNEKSCTKKIKGDKKNQKKEEYISINKVFEDVYNSKDEEIISLIKSLGNKILEYDDVLYKKYKSSFDKDNSQLLLFEKNIINFKDKQIQFFKKLINYFDNAENSFSKFKFNLEEFYTELSKYYNNKNSTELNDSFKKDKNIFCKNLKLSAFNDKKLQNISVIKKTEDNLYNSNKVSEDSVYNDEIIKERIDKIFDNNKKKNDILKKEIYLSKSTKINKNKKFDLKENFSNIEKIEKNSSNKKLMTKKKDISKDENNKIPQNINRNINNNKNIKTIINRINESDDEIQNESFNKNKINILYQISENKHEDTESFSDNIDSKSDSELNNSKIKKNRHDSIRQKTLNYNLIKKLEDRYHLKTKDRKASHRLKKLGSNMYDFII